MTRERPAAVHREANSGEGQAATLDGAFRGRVRQSPDAVAYVQFDPATRRWQEATWAETAREVARWQVGLGTLGLCPGDRVAVMLGNGPDWVAFDQAALGLGLVTVPLYPGDRPDNVDWVLRDSGSRALLIEGREQWRVLQPIALTLSRLEAVISRRGIPADAPNLRHAASWLPDSGPTLAPSRNHPDDLATLVYTSGTTGRPKGVMLSHGNILANVRAGLASVEVEPNDCFLSFLPLSHMLERTIGYYLPLVAGCRVAYARSIADLADDMIQVRPTILVSVPRVFERVQARIQETLAAAPPLKRWLLDLALTLGWRRHLHSRGRAPWSPGLLVQPVLDALAGAPVRARLGGRLRFAISGGAPLPEAVGRFFIALGVEILQGYGLTETSPVISVNRPGDNEPGSVGPPLPGVQIRIGADDELLARGPSVMQGYWHDPDTTRALIDAAGWLHTGDQARIGPRGHITITGRLKDVLVLSTGEKVSPADIEQALVASPLVEQVMVIGDGRPYLSALVVPKPQVLARMAATLGLAGATADEDLRRHPAIERDLLGRLQPHLSAFPGYAKLVRLALAEAPWTLENGLMTPTLKLKRREILRRYAGDLERLYVGH
jgi:long-chain acyl-CoA synthetase